jgi:ABC-2 type transport system ATP-binding protein
MGLVPEEPALYDYLTAREFLEFVVGVRGKGDVEEALELSGLGVDADRLIREYSQGMRRRAALAAAVVSRPPLLVLDEALNGLDPVSSERVEKFLQRRCAAGDAVLLSTHLLDAVEQVASRIVMLKGGKVVEDVQVASLGMEGVRGLFKRHMGE